MIQVTQIGPGVSILLRGDAGQVATKDEAGIISSEATPQDVAIARQNIEWTRLCVERDLHGDQYVSIRGHIIYRDTDQNGRYQWKAISAEDRTITTCFPGYSLADWLCELEYVHHYYEQPLGAFA